MNCSECQEQLTAYVEGLLEPQFACEVARHVEGCAACAAEAAGHRTLRERLVADGRAFAEASFETAVMARIGERRSLNLRRIAMRKRYGKAGLGLAAAAAAVAFFAIPWGGTSTGRATAAEVLAQAVQALSKLHSVYLRMNVRSAPADNFLAVRPTGDFVTQEMWKEFGNPPKWRVEKAGRVTVMDGTSSLLFIKTGDRGVAVKREAGTAFDSPQELAHVDRILDQALRMAEEMGWETQVTEVEGADGRQKLVVTIEAQAQGDFTNDYLLNTSISASDHRSVYWFDAQTNLLEDLEVWMHVDDKDVLVLDVVEIVYDPEIAPDVFALELPENVIWVRDVDVLADNDKYAEMSPEEATRAFFEACAGEDWDEVLKFGSVSEIPQSYKDYLGGLAIISIGEPFKSGQYSGWFIPYEVRLKSGRALEHNLALRNDNPAQRWVVDGGI